MDGTRFTGGVQSLSEEIDITGTLQSLLSGMERLAAIVRQRKNDGWSLFRSDETWKYFTAQDEPELTCDDCLRLARNEDYTGDEVRTDFPAREIVEPITVRPNVHEDPQYYYLRGRCRCVMIFQDYIQTLTERLADEMRRVL